MKHFHQILYTNPSILNAHLTENEAALLRGCFQEMMPVNDETMALVRQCPEDWVMKPNRGGGGNNLFGHEIVQPEEPDAWSLQRMIRPSSHPTRVRRPGEPERECQVIPEVSIYGSIMWQEGKLLMSRPSGYLVRSKPVGAKECGINAGNGFLDSIILLPD